MPLPNLAIPSVSSRVRTHARTGEQIMAGCKILLGLRFGRHGKLHCLSYGMMKTRGERFRTQPPLSLPREVGQPHFSYRDQAQHG